MAHKHNWGDQSFQFHANGKRISGVSVFWVCKRCGMGYARKYTFRMPATTLKERGVKPKDEATRAFLEVARWGAQVTQETAPEDAVSHRDDEPTPED